MILTTFVILHIITAAAWFGLGLRLSAQARLALGIETSAALTITAYTRRTVRLMEVFVVLTFVFALIAFFLGGGFARYGMQYHTSLLLMLILVAVQFAMIRPAWGRIEAAMSRPEPAANEGSSYVGHIAMGMGIAHLLWLVILVLMFWNWFLVRP